jgi:hypothetical protein
MLLSTCNATVPIMREGASESDGRPRPSRVSKERDDRYGAGSFLQLVAGHLARLPQKFEIDSL